MAAHSPIQTIWYQPGITVRRIAHENPGYGLFVLPFLAGLAFSPLEALFFPEQGVFTRGFVWSSLLAFSPLVELLQVFVGSWFLHAIGQRLGGRADIESVAPIVAWSNAPVLVLTAIGCVVFVFLSVTETTFASFVRAADSGAVGFMCGVLVMLELAVIFLSMRILVTGLAAVHGYSTLRALQTVLLAWLAVAAVIAAAALMLGLSPYLGRFFLGSGWGLT